MAVTDIGCDSLSEFGSLEVGNIQGGFGPYEYSLDGMTFQNGTNFDGLPEGSYTIWVRDSFGCTSTQEVEVEEFMAIQVDLGPDREVFEGDLVQLLADCDQNPLDVSWNTRALLNCDDCINPAFRADSSVLVMVTVWDENGCLDTDEVWIQVLYRRIFVPNTFSPNGDQINDILSVFGSDQVKVIRKFTVYDRWGEVVHNRKMYPPDDPNLGWNGMFNGKVLDSGVFVALLEVEFNDGSTAFWSGDVTLIR